MESIMLIVTTILNKNVNLDKLLKNTIIENKITLVALGLHCAMHKNIEVY